MQDTNVEAHHVHVPTTLPPVAVLGAGRIGQTIALDCLMHGAEHVDLIDVDEKRAQQVAARWSTHGSISGKGADLTDPRAVVKLLDNVATVISAVPYRLNLDLATETVRHGKHWVDLGGNTEVVEAILALDGRAKNNNVSVIPDAGLQPGLGNILAGELFREMHGADVLRVLVGGLPQHPTGVLKYQLVFSIEGLLNEYHGAVRTLDQRTLRIREPLSEVEPFPWETLPALECFHTSGSASTLPSTFAGQVDRLEVKTVRYVGHAAALETIFQEVPQSKRQEYFASMLPTEGADLVVMCVEGEKDGVRRTFEMEDHYEEATGLTAMMRTTGFPAAIVAQLATLHELPVGGVVQERDIPARPVIEGLRERGISIKEMTSSVE